MKYTVELSEEEEKALLTDMIDIQTQIDNYIHNKARQCIDRIVEATSNKQAKKLPIAQKLAIVRKAKVKTAAEIEADLLKEGG